MKNSTLCVVVSVLFFVVCVGWLLLCLSLPFRTTSTLTGGPGTFPFLALSIMTAGFGYIVVKEYAKMRRGDDTQGMNPASCKRVLLFFAVIVAYVMLIEFMGYIPATVLLLLASLLLFGERDRRVLVVVPLLFPAALWLLFQRLLEVQLP